MKTESLLKKYFFLNDIKNQLSDNIDFSQSSITEVLDNTLQKSYTTVDKNVPLHDYIFKFYAYNEIIHSLKHKHNGIIAKQHFSIFSDYEKFINDFSKRIFSFILYSCFSEVRHCDFIEIDNLEENYAYYENMQKQFVTDTISGFQAGKKNKLFISFLQHLKKNLTDNKYNQVIKKHTTLKKLFNDYLYHYCDVPHDLPEKFKKDFKNFHINNLKVNINPHALYIFDSFYGKNKRLLYKHKLERFSQFWLFLESVAGSDNIGDGGSLQRELIQKKLIQKSIIKDFTTKEILEFLSAVFSYGFSDTASFGGLAWSDIAQHALSFSQGKINAEIFIDQSLSLEHNSGQMFNKNFIFSEDFSSCYLNFIDNDQDSLNNNKLGMNLKEMILHLQSSSSVLSLFHVVDTNWKTLVSSLNTKQMKGIHPQLSFVELNLFKENFLELQKFSKKLTFLPEMTAIAKKIDYSVPMLNFNMLISTAIDKNSAVYYQEKLERSLDINQLFTTILSGNFSILDNGLNNKKNPSFSIHNINSNQSKNLSKELLGSKAFGLNELIHKGFNVPKAMVFDTDTCLTYLSKPQFFHKQYKTIQEKINHYLVDDDNNPILVSIRSGSSVSMPGMMDSILNVGIDDSTYLSLCKIHTKKLVNECSISFMTQFCSSKLGLDIQFPKVLHKALDKFTEILIKNDIACDRKNLFPLSKEAQIKLCVEAVFDSWNSPRAIAWRNEKKISHTIGTAATIQQMVFGNRNEQSFTCVVFSRDCISGKPVIMGEYLIKSQGEDLVSGKRTPLPISELKKTHPSVYQQIEYIAKTLEEEKKAIQDIEITVDNGKVYILQMRNAVVSAEAQISLSKELNLNLLDIVQPKNLIGEAKIDTQLAPHFSGLSGSTGLISGIIVKNIQDIEKYKSYGKDLIFFSNQALPEHAPIMIATQGFITQFGGATSHAAILARSMDKPCIVGIGKQILHAGDTITMDASNGHIWKGILPIIINQHNAIQLSNQILRENNITAPEKLPFNNFLLQSWTTQLVHSTVMKQTKNNNKLFLNIAQQTALLLKMEHNKKSMKM